MVVMLFCVQQRVFWLPLPAAFFLSLELLSFHGCVVDLDWGLKDHKSVAPTTVESVQLLGFHSFRSLLSASWIV